MVSQNRLSLVMFENVNVDNIYMFLDDEDIQYAENLEILLTELQLKPK